MRPRSSFACVAAAIALFAAAREGRAADPTPPSMKWCERSQSGEQSVTRSIVQVETAPPGGALLSAAAGTVFGAFALHDLNDFHGGTNTKFNEGQNFMALSGASFVASAALGALGIYLYLKRNAPLDWRGYFASVRPAIDF